jgi:hypothetical protein
VTYDVNRFQAEEIDRHLEESAEAARRAERVARQLDEHAAFARAFAECLRRADEDLAAGRTRSLVVLLLKLIAVL